jgi:3-oxoacyl-[acyl-carrier-protein] synthase II
MVQLNGVAVTGLGVICGLGHNVEEVWKGLIEGRSGVSEFSNFPIDQLPIKFGGEIKSFKINDDLINPKDQAKYDSFIHYALHSAQEALTQAIGPDGLLPYAPHRMGSIVGVGMGGFPFIENSYRVFLEKGSRRVTPFFIPSVIPNMTSGIISIRYGLKGINYSISSACASGAHSIMAAAQEIQMGRQDLMVAGGSEGVLCHLPISGFSSMKALSKGEMGATKASRPFDSKRDGFVIGEGAGILILENLEKAKSRGAKILAEIVGSGANSDAHHITAPHPEGEGALNCMLMAIEQAKIKKEQIGYINAHGTSTPLGDIAETNAIKKTFQAHAHKLLVSSTKSMTGHTLGAAGGVESVVCVKALMTGLIPPTINLDQPDPECDLDYVANHMRKSEIEYALNNSFGFGGTNGCLIFKKA